MNYTKFSDIFHSIVNTNAKFEKLETGFKSIEGPIWIKETQSLVFTDFIAEKIFVWSEKSGLKLFNSNNTGRAVGLALDNNNNIIMCESKNRCISRFSNNSDNYIIATHYNNLMLNSPNDVIVSSDGSIFFTDPYSNMLNMKKELNFNGVFKISPDYKQIELVSNVFIWPNGLALSTNENKLYVNDTSNNSIYYLSKDNNGFRNLKLFAKLDHSFGKGSVDGLKVDSADNIYTTGPGGIWIFDKNGIALGIIKTPEITLNFTFGGYRNEYIYFGTYSSLYRLKLF